MFGTQLLDKAKAIGFTPNNFSIMPFDGGFAGASSQTFRAGGVPRPADEPYGLGQHHRYNREGFSG